MLSCTGNAWSYRLPNSRVVQELQDPSQVESCVKLPVSLVAILQAMDDPRTSTHYKSCKLAAQAQVQKYVESLDCDVDQYTLVYPGLVESYVPNLKGMSTVLLLRLETRLLRGYCPSR